MKSTTAPNSAAPFKICPMCGYQWVTVEQLVTDGTLRVNGYQAAFGRAEDGLIFLTHECPGCNTTLAVGAASFAHWNLGPRCDHLSAFEENCPRYCTDRENLEPCPADCSMRWVRDVLQYLERHEIPLSGLVTSDSADHRGFSA
ncbi:hypothetical protein HZB60_02350 [candidate division KSB1 bacterium]|nr:hypothetical protein [candidate division KSB1 bacterium]